MSFMCSYSSIWTSNRVRKNQQTPSLAPLPAAPLPHPLCRTPPAFGHLLSSLIFSFSSISVFAGPRPSFPRFHLARGPVRTGPGLGPAGPDADQPTRHPARPTGPGAKLLRTLYVQGVPASTGVSHHLRRKGPPAGGVGSYPLGARGLRLRGLHLPTTVRSNQE